MTLFHKHKWSNLSAPFDTQADYKKLQSRYCIDCNKCQVKQIKQPWNQWFSAKAIIKASRGEE